MSDLFVVLVRRMSTKLRLVPQHLVYATPTTHNI